MLSWLVNKSVPSDGNIRLIVLYGTHPQRRQYDLIPAVRQFYLFIVPCKLRNGFTGCTASFVPIRNLLDLPPHCSLNWTLCWKLSNTINQQISFKSNWLTFLTMLHVSDELKWSQYLQETVIPRNDVACLGVSCVPQLYIAVERIRQQWGRLRKLDIRCKISSAITTCLSLKSIKCSPSWSELISWCDKRKAHCCIKNASIHWGSLWNM